MFYTEEDVQPAIDLTNKIFGMPNQFHSWSEGPIMMNVTLMTREYGKLWFGDILIDPEAGDGATYIQNKLDVLSDSIGQTVYMTTDYGFDYNRALSVGG